MGGRLAGQGEDVRENDNDSGEPRRTQKQGLIFLC